MGKCAKRMNNGRLKDLVKRLRPWARIRNDAIHGRGVVKGKSWPGIRVAIEKVDGLIGAVYQACIGDIGVDE
jgi:hypothetical protein